MREAFEHHRVPSARFRAVRTKEDASRAVAELDTWPLIVKPSNSRGGGSRGVMRISSERDLEPALHFAQSFYDQSEVIIEECFEGSEHSVETITYEGTTAVIAVSDKVKSPPPYRVDKAVIYPTRLPPDKLSVLEQVVTAAVRAVGVTWGPVHVELSYEPDGPRVIELGARCGGGGTPDPIVPFVTGVEMLQEVIRMSLGERPGSLTPERQWGCVYHFLTPAPGILHRVEGLDRVREWRGILDCDVSILPGQEIRPVRIGADRAGFVIAGDEKREVAIGLAEKAEQTIKFHVEDRGARAHAGR
ncbi:MAG: ATP-grasp domain-containing protein [Actinomycetota bacterium]|nr:ATP-grasp domain-containing protein [Actinomycetota bacterium]